MRKLPNTSQVESANQSMDLSHLRRETRTALELAIAALAPTDLIDRLAWAAGLLEALAELPSDSPPVVALMPKLTSRARSTLTRWQEWWQQKSKTKVEV